MSSDLPRWLTGLGGAVVVGGAGVYWLVPLDHGSWIYIVCMAAFGFALGAWVGPESFGWVSGDL